MCHFNIYVIFIYIKRERKKIVRSCPSNIYLFAFDLLKGIRVSIWHLTWNQEGEKIGEGVLFCIDGIRIHWIETVIKYEEGSDKNDVQTIVNGCEYFLCLLTRGRWHANTLSLVLPKKFLLFSSIT